MVLALCFLLFPHYLPHPHPLFSSHAGLLSWFLNPHTLPAWVHGPWAAFSCDTLSFLSRSSLCVTSLGKASCLSRSTPILAHWTCTFPYSTCHSKLHIYVSLWITFVFPIKLYTLYRPCLLCSSLHLQSAAFLTEEEAALFLCHGEDQGRRRKSFQGSPYCYGIKIQCQDICYKTNKNFKGKFKSWVEWAIKNFKGLVVDGGWSKFSLLVGKGPERGSDSPGLVFISPHKLLPMASVARLENTKGEPLLSNPLALAGQGSNPMGFLGETVVLFELQRKGPLL